MLNNVVLIGRLTDDITLRYTQNGHAVGAFTLAVDRGFSSQDGEETDFINIVAWRKLAETCAKHIGKGRLVAVEGRLQIRSYEDKEGINRKVAEVVANQVRFLDYAKDKPTADNYTPRDQQQQGSATAVKDDFDDVPF